MNVQRVDEIIDSYEADRTCTLAILQDVQAEYKYLPREAIIQTANRLGVTLGEVYQHGHLLPGLSAWSPRASIPSRSAWALPATCAARSQILEQFERDLGIRAGETSPDRRFSLEVVMCLGACALGPVVVVNEEHARRDVARQGARARGRVDGWGRREGRVMSETRTVTVCQGTGCESHRSGQLRMMLEAEVARLGLPVQVKRTGCHGLCERGPIVTVEPDGILYLKVQPKDVPDIAKSLENGDLVKRLLLPRPGRPESRCPTTGRGLLQQADAAGAAPQRAYRPRVDRRLCGRGRLPGAAQGPAGDDATSRSSPRSRIPACGAGAGPASSPASSGSSPARPPARSSTSSPTATRATPALSWTAASWRATPTASSRA